MIKPIPAEYITTNQITLLNAELFIMCCFIDNKQWRFPTQHELESLRIPNFNYHTTWTVEDLDERNSVFLTAFVLPVRDD